MTVDTAYKLIQFAANKAQAGYIGPADFNLVINAGQDGWQDYILGEFQKTIPGRQNLDYSHDQNTRQSITPTLYYIDLAVASNGFSAYPNDYLQTDGMWTIYGTQKIRWIRQDKLDAAYGSVIDPVITNPIFLIERDGFRFYPNNIGSARLAYIQRAPRIVWNYTLDGNGRPIYTPSGSVDPVWPDVDMMDVIARALRLVGVNLESPVIAQYANEIKGGGQ